MPKKIDDPEVKKECPSCGLGVALDSKICEFCGWDFEEEDEWILQIEKLERDLMMEKQKFEPGTVNEKIESTLHTPALEQQAVAKAVQKPEPEISKAPAPQAPKPVPSPEPIKPVVVARPPASKPGPVKQAPVTQPARKAPEVPPPEVTPSKVRRVRVVKSTPAQGVGEEGEGKKKLVRKVKQ